MYKSPTLIRGVLYESQAEAARCLGIRADTLRRIINNGNIDNAGLGRNGWRLRPVTVNGKTMPSKAEAAKHLGLSDDILRGRINRAARKGKKSITVNGSVVEWE